MKACENSILQEED